MHEDSDQDSTSRSAGRNVNVAEYPGIKAGPDLDVVIERTMDGHFTVAGLQRAAEL